MTMRGVLVACLLVAILGVGVHSYPARKLDLAEELLNEAETEGDEVEVKSEDIKKDEVAGSGAAARKDTVAVEKKEDPESDESDSPASGDEDTSGDDSTDVAASGNSESSDEAEVTAPKQEAPDEKSEDKGEDEDESPRVDVKVEGVTQEDNGSTSDNNQEGEETWNGEKKSKVSKPERTSDLVKAGKPCKRCDCGCKCCKRCDCGCDCDEPDEEHEHHHCCHGHEEGCHGDHDEDCHHCEEEGHHQHDDCCHHHGHHHGFVHEWGEECCGDHHEHDCCGEHEHCHHDCGDHEHEHCHHGDHCCHHEEEEEEHPCCCCHKRSKCPKGKKRCCCKRKKSSKGVVSGSTRNLVLHPSNAMKKQTVHVGYGYSSGDNYRLGFQQGGMGALSSQFTGEISPQDQEEGVSAPLPNTYVGGGGENFRSHHARHRVRNKRNNFGGFGGHGFGNLESGIAHGSATPYGHPVTHPGFTTMGFPGHALASQDVRNGIPRTNAAKRSVGYPENYIGVKMY